MKSTWAMVKHVAGMLQESLVAAVRFQCQQDVMDAVDQKMIDLDMVRHFLCALREAKERTEKLPLGIDKVLKPLCSLMQALQHIHHEMCR